jgi:Glycosyltransferase family 28 C-terminal domain/Monogalactosyldiacylglycerol (MGDG) synthase
MNTNSLLSTSTTQEKFSIHIVTGKGGGGHYATYHAIRAIAEQKQLPWEFHIVDMDDIMASMTEQKQVLNAYKLLGSSVADLYNLMLKSGWTWFWFLQIRLNKLLVKLNYAAGVKFFEQYWREHPPDMVVSVVTMCNKVLAEALQRVKPGTPYVTVPIDFADYPPGFWFEPQTDNYTVCATQKAIAQARSLGVREDFIVPTSGMVVHPRFHEPIKGGREIERQRLGLDPDCLTGVVLFGGNGSQVMLDIAKRLERFGERLQLIFLCGRNEKLASAIEESQGKQKRFVTTFTTDIPYYMCLADFFIGKPGPGSISEALAMKLPVITVCNFSTLVHERYNAQWVKEKQMAIVLRSFSQIDKAVEQFLDQKIFARYRANVESYNNRAVFEVCDFLEKILATRYPTTAIELVEQK